MSGTSLPPSLLVSNEKHPEGQTALTFYGLREERVETRIIPELNDKRVLISAYGWLVLIDQGTGNLSLWNPTSAETVELPELENSSMYHLCVLSKPPTDPDCRILLHCGYLDKLAFCRPGDDEFVVKSKGHDGLDKGRLLIIDRFVSFRGEIYCYAEEDCCSCFKSVRFVGKTLEFTPIFTWDEYPFAFLKACTGLRIQYLVNSACGSEVFLLSEIMRSRHSYEAGLKFRVFRVDLDKKECVALDNIGNQAIFLSHQEFGDNVFCCSSTKLIMANSIYYTVPNSKNLYRYSLDDQSRTNMLPFTSTGRPKCFWVESEVFKGISS